MSKLAIAAVLFAAAATAGGCTSDEYVRHEGVTVGAGDAIASNTVLQMVDPWQRGVEDTDLSVPADHKQYQPQPLSEGPRQPVSNTSTSDH